MSSRNSLSSRDGGRPFSANRTQLPPQRRNGRPHYPEIKQRGYYSDILSGDAPQRLGVMFGWFLIYVWHKWTYNGWREIIKQCFHNQKDFVRLSLTKYSHVCVVVRKESNLCLNMLMELALTMFSGNLFHMLMTCWLKSSFCNLMIYTISASISS